MEKFQIRRKTEPYVLMGSDYSQQEPKLCAFISSDPKMLEAIRQNKDIYSTIAALSFHKTYEECLEKNAVTGETQKEGKELRSQAKKIVLGILYGRSVPSIGEQLFGGNKTMTEKEKTDEAQKIYDAVLTAFPNLKALMYTAQQTARTKGYVETILGRRRHIPEMRLPKYEFKPMEGYVNPDIDPLNPETLKDEHKIPQRIIDALTREFDQLDKGYRKNLYDRINNLRYNHIEVISNSKKISDGERECVNCVDLETMILTTKGWRHYNEVVLGDEILSYDIDNHCITLDKIRKVVFNPESTEVYEFKAESFDAICTPDHRWVVRDLKNSKDVVKTAKDIVRAEERASERHQSRCFGFPILKQLTSEDELNGNLKTLSRLPRFMKYVPLKSISKTTVDGTWCVTTGNGTWIAKRRGTVFITHNSIIQGSAAELTKIAILMLTNNKRFNELGGRLLIPVHDELICEAPLSCYKECAQILHDCMVKAGEFLPFKIDTDVEVTIRWYGLAYPNIYTKPMSLYDMTEDEIKWVQWYLVEADYQLPVYKDENGDEPEGDAAKGVNGVDSPEFQSAIDAYCEKYHITRDDFIDFAIDHELYVDRVAYLAG